MQRDGVVKGDDVAIRGVQVCLPQQSGRTVDLSVGEENPSQRIHDLRLIWGQFQCALTMLHRTLVTGLLIEPGEVVPHSWIVGLCRFQRFELLGRCSEVTERKVAVREHHSHGVVARVILEPLLKWNQGVLSILVPLRSKLQSCP